MIGSPSSLRSDVVLSQELSSNDRNLAGAQGQHTFSIKARDDFIHFHINILDSEGLCCPSQLRRGRAKPPRGTAVWLRSSRTRAMDTDIGIRIRVFGHEIFFFF